MGVLYMGGGGGLGVGISGQMIKYFAGFPLYMKGGGRELFTQRSPPTFPLMKLSD